MNNGDLPKVISNGERVLFIPGATPKVRDAVSEVERVGLSVHSAEVNKAVIRKEIASATELPRLLVALKTEDIDRYHRMGVESDEVTREGDFNEYHDPVYSEYTEHPVRLKMIKQGADFLLKRAIKGVIGQRADRLVLFEDLNEHQKARDDARLSHWKVMWNADIPNGFNTSLCLEYMANHQGVTWPKLLSLNYTDDADKGHTNSSLATFKWQFLYYIRGKLTDSEAVKINFNGYKQQAYDFSGFGLINDLLCDIPSNSGEGGYLYKRPSIEFKLGEYPSLLIKGDDHSLFEVEYNFNLESGHFKRGDIFERYSDAVRRSRIIKEPILDQDTYIQLLTSALKLLPVEQATS